MSRLPVVVVGAGPVGLAAACRLADEGLPFVVLEAGDRVGAAVSRWGHVRLFSPWRYVIDDSARARLEAVGWKASADDATPTGADLVTDYLAPLAAHPALAPHIRTRTRVQSITRAGLDKLSDTGRGERPFAVWVQAADGRREVIRARAVVDASGTYDTPNPLGAGGVPAFGELAAADRLHYGIPDVGGAERDRFAGARVGVVGSGHSAFNALLALLALPVGERPRVTWFVRSRLHERLFGGGDADALSERGALGRRMRDLVASGRLIVRESFPVVAVEAASQGVRLHPEEGAPSEVLDVVVVVTGFRPDLTITSELRVALDPAVEAPVALAPLIDPNLHSCGTVPPHGFRELGHPDEGYYTVGMKSYGRAPTFLLMTGYEQVRSVVKVISGDLASASDVQLVLPHSGVCATDQIDFLEGSVASPERVCCAPVGDDAEGSPSGSAG